MNFKLTFQNVLKITYSSKQWAAVNTSLSVMTDPPHTWAPFSVNITFESQTGTFSNHFSILLWVYYVTFWSEFNTN